MIPESSILVCTPGAAYAVTIGRGALRGIGALAAEVTDARRCALVTDDSVGELYGSQAEAALEGAGLEAVRFTVPAGERSKSWSEAGRLLEAFSEAGLGRDALVVALGGGVVGDLAGFCAATYLRGVPVLQVPTTLLAQVDSAIGGKTGVDLPRGKNLVGAFWQPVGVVSDTTCLETLPEQEWHSGLAEVVKSAILDSDSSLATLEADAPALTYRDADAVHRSVHMAACLKAAVVSGDEREAADRECLNYGHTLAHALERELGYGRITHGAAVAEGIRFAARLAERVAGTDPAWTRRQESLLDALGLARMAPGCEPRGLLAAMRSDKKVRAGRVRFVLSLAPGEWKSQTVGEDVLLTSLAQWCGSDSGGVS